MFHGFVSVYVCKRSQAPIAAGKNLSLLCVMCVISAPETSL